MNTRTYTVYIITNWEKSVLYVGVTNDMGRRLNEHFSGLKDGFTQRYSCKYLIYYEDFKYILNAIAREKELKGWNRKKKEELISGSNPNWIFLNERFMNMKEDQ